MERIQSNSQVTIDNYETQIAQLNEEIKDPAELSMLFMKKE